MIDACVIGWPIEHSRSPLIHNYWLKHYEIQGRYDKRAVKPEDAARFMSTLNEKRLAGCNVTVPLKEIAFKTAQIKEPSAETVGAANTLWLDEKGRLCAANTDTYGFMSHLEERLPNWRGKATLPISILGAGGAARAIIYGFQKAGIKKIHIYNRTHERAVELADAFGEGVVAQNWKDRFSTPRDSAVIVNTTTIGMNDNGDLGIDFKNANPQCIACDIVYVPLETDFLKRARTEGLATLDGLGMLLHQAVPGFEKWFGVRPKVTPELRAVVLESLEA